MSDLNDISNDDPAAFVIAAYRATEYIYRPQSRASFDEIISSGSMGLIPVGARQAGFTDYYRRDTSAEMMEEMTVSPYRIRIRRLVPHDVQTAIRANCNLVEEVRAEILGIKKGCELGLSEKRLEETAATLFSDKELLPDLRLQFSVLLARGTTFRRDVQRLEASIAALQAAG